MTFSDYREFATVFSQMRKPPGEKIARVFELSARVKAIAEAGLRHRFPEASDNEIRMRAIRQRLGDALSQFPAR